MYQGGGKPDTGKFHSSYIGMNVRVVPPMRMGVLGSMARVLRQRIEYYYYYVNTLYIGMTMVS